MIAKCIVVLALVAQIRASVCGCGMSSLVMPTVGSNVQSPALLVSGNSDSSFGGSSGTITRNIVAKGKYPVALRNCGPTPDQQIPVTTTRLTAPVQEKPTIRLPSAIPAPRTVAHSCTCYKTIMRPRVHQQIITVPTVERYVETTHKPVVENIQYEAIPVNCNESGASSGSGIQFVQVGNEGSSKAAEVVSFGSNISYGSQGIQIPVVPTVQVPQYQSVQFPQSFRSCQC